MNKKKLEQRVRERVQREATDRNESKLRREKIKIRWGLDPLQLRKGNNLKGFEQLVRTLKREKLKKLLGSLKKFAGEGDLYDQVSEIVELAALQDKEIEHLSPFRDILECMETHSPEQFRDLSLNSLSAELRPHIELMLAEQPPKKKYDRKRSRVGSGGIGEIEIEFTGRASAPPGYRKPFDAAAAYERLLGTSRLLDDVFRGRGVSMLRLQELFGLHRNRFPQKLPHIKIGRETLYDYRAVTKIMNALLSEKPRTWKRGRPAKQWLSQPALRVRVLGSIEARIKSIPVAKEIASQFVSVVHRHMPPVE